MFSLRHIKQRRAAGVVTVHAVRSLLMERCRTSGHYFKIFPQKSLSAFRSYQHVKQLWRGVFCCFLQFLWECLRECLCGTAAWWLPRLLSIDISLISEGRCKLSQRQNGPPTCPHCKTNMSIYSIFHLTSFAACKSKNSSTTGESSLVTLEVSMKLQVSHTVEYYW